MKRIEILGLAAVAALIMAATLASPATAAIDPALHADEYPITVKATNPGEDLHTFTGKETFLWCDESSFEGELTEESDALLTDPDMSCETAKVPGMELEANGCQIRHNVEDETSPGVTEGTMDIVCPGESPGIVLKSSECTRKFPPQTGLGPVEYVNLHGVGEAPEVEVSAEITNMDYEFTDKGEGKDSLCDKSGSDGNYFGSWRMAGFKGEEQVSLQVGYGPYNGPTGLLYVEEGSSVLLKGANVNTHTLLLNSEFAYHCEPDFIWEVSTPAESVDLQPTFNCNWFGIPESSVTWEMNECRFKLKFGKEGVPGEFGGGQTDFICPEGKKAHVKATVGKYSCSAWLPSQFGFFNRVRYENVGSGSEAAVRMHFEVTDLVYQADGPPSEACERTGPGEFHGVTELTGFQPEWEQKGIYIAE